VALTLHYHCLCAATHKEVHPFVAGSGRGADHVALPLVEVAHEVLELHWIEALHLLQRSQALEFTHHGSGELQRCKAQNSSSGCYDHRQVPAVFLSIIAKVSDSIKMERLGVTWTAGIPACTCADRDAALWNDGAPI